jgi:AcrR family transcriptional regulator
MLDAARTLLAARGPAGVSMQGVAEALGAPSGSIYHRFASRDELMATMWLRAVERFQEGYLAALAGPDACAAARRAAAHVLSWSRSNFDDARILLRYRSEDLAARSWPAESARRNGQQREGIADALAALGSRLGAVSADDHLRVRFAVVDLPYAGVREALRRDEPPAPALDALVDTAVVAILEVFVKNGDT